MNRRHFIAAAAAVTGLFMSVSAHAQATWIMASGQPESSFITQNIRMFIKEVEEKTGGQLKIDLRPNDSLIKLDAVKRAVQSGQVPIGEIRFGVYGNEAAVYNLDGIPGVAATYDRAKKLLDAQRPVFDDLFKRNGMQVLAYLPYPGQGFFTKEPVTSLEDLKGQKLRVYSRATQQMGEKLGMEALILPFAEVPQAFATGMVEALWTSAQTGTDIQVWDYVKNYSRTGSQYPKNAVIVNERAMRALDPAVREAVLEAGRNATARSWEMAEAAGREREETLKSHGVTISEAPQEVMDRIDAIGEELIQEWLASANDAEKASYEAYRASLD